MKILFICKKNECYGFETYTRRSSGLYNSTRFITESLCATGIDAKIIEVVDNNCIDREVTQFRPDVVVIEALWVVPEKFDVLKKLHPTVKWYIHLHSHMPFLALEGIATQWILAYSEKGLGLIANSLPSYKALCSIVRGKLVYLPNVYISHPMKPMFPKKDCLDVGCFGAVRPMKNHLLQAMAALRFAAEKNLYLRFHINSSRIETGGAPVLKNLVELFANDLNAELVRSKWNEPEEFLEYLHRDIDIGMQVSLTETFNVVCADYVTAGVPIVTSKEVKWASSLCWAKDDDIDDIVKKMHRVYKSRWLVRRNQRLLLKNSKRAQLMWWLFVKELGESECQQNGCLK